MSKSNAQRQAAYRARHLHDINGAAERLNMIVSVQAKRALERLASSYGVTQRQMLERLITQAEWAALERLAPLPNGYADYYERRLRFESETDPDPVTA